MLSMLLKALMNSLVLTGVVLTKLDGDTRGGAALSIRSVTKHRLNLSVWVKKWMHLKHFIQNEWHQEF